MGRGKRMSADSLALNALDLLESILDEQLEHETEPSHQLAQGLFDLAVAGVENRVIPPYHALRLMTQCYGVLHPDARPYWQAD